MISRFWQQQELAVKPNVMGPLHDLQRSSKGGDGDGDDDGDGIADCVYLQLIGIPKRLTGSYLRDCPYRKCDGGGDNDEQRVWEMVMVMVMVAIPPSTDSIASL